MKIAICGPAASGKGTIARKLAIEAGIGYVDLGLLFRFGAFALETGEITSIDQLPNLVRSGTVIYSWRAGAATIVLRNADITTLLLSQEVAQATSILASDASAQRELTVVANLVLESFGDVVCDGRSAGITILPNADYKFFVTASIKERARRRHLDVLRLGGATSYEEVLQSIKERDKRDSERATHPLIIPAGAIVLETDTRSIEESILFMWEIIRKQH